MGIAKTTNASVNPRMYARNEAPFNAAQSTENHDGQHHDQRVHPHVRINDGSGATMAPATAAIPTEIPRATIISLLTFMPIKLATSRS